MDYYEQFRNEDREIDFDDSLKCCPSCEKPNQFGETCATCVKDHQRDIEYKETRNEYYYVDFPEYFGGGYDPSEYIE